MDKSELTKRQNFILQIIGVLGEASNQEILEEIEQYEFAVNNYFL